MGLAVTLLDEIRALRDTIAYCENKILRKEIAILEILSSEPGAAPSYEGMNDLMKKAVAAPSKPVDAAPSPSISVRGMIEELLPELNGSVFWYSDMKTKMIAKYPAHESRIRRGVHQASYVLLQQGVIEKCPGGLRRKQSD
jgi:hypothetical protein